MVQTQVLAELYPIEQEFTFACNTPWMNMRVWESASEWCTEQFGQPGEKWMYHGAFRFKNECDMIWFKMRWL